MRVQALNSRATKTDSTSSNDDFVLILLNKSTLKRKQHPILTRRQNGVSPLGAGTEGVPRSLLDLLQNVCGTVRVVDCADIALEEAVEEFQGADWSGTVSGCVSEVKYKLNTTLINTSIALAHIHRCTFHNNVATCHN